MEEIWKDIIGYDGHYCISNLGRVKSIKCREKILKPSKNNNGYLYITLSKYSNCKIFLIHRLVALAFIENPNEYRCVNHIDGNKQNNNVVNLEWCTHSANNKHAYSIGIRVPIEGNKHKVYVYDKNLNFIKVFESTKLVAEWLGCSRSQVIHCCSGHSKSIRGYILLYEKDNNPNTLKAKALKTVPFQGRCHTDASRQKMRDKAHKRKVVLHGIEYESVHSALKALNISTSTFYKMIKGD